MSFDCSHRSESHKEDAGSFKTYHCHLLKSTCTIEDYGLVAIGTGKPLPVCSGCKDRIAGPSVDVVVTCHNYERFLEECLESIRGAALVIVVDDSSDDGKEVERIANIYGAKYLRVNLHSPHMARGAGFALCKSPLVCFLDADNTHQSGYLSEASRMFDRNPRLAIAYPDLINFGAKNVKTEHPEVFNMADLESQNFIDTGSVWLAEALKQQFLFDGEPAGLEDWRISKEIMRSGNWEAEKNPIPINYRKHTDNRLDSGVYGKSYFQRSGLSDETVTIFTTFSKRIQNNPDLWEKRKSWLRSQTWKKIRFVVSNTSHSPMPDGWDKDLPCMQGVSVYSHDVGFPGLEDKDRAGSVSVENDVSTAVASIYNRMWKETSTEFVFVLEDDVFPKRIDAIECLMKGFDQKVCAVTGQYRQRYYPYAVTYWPVNNGGGSPKLRHQAPGEGIIDISGAGFGCVMLRRSHMADEVVVANSKLSRYYDVDLFSKMKSKGMKVRINFGVMCDHDGPLMPPPPMPVDKLTIVMTTICRDSFEKSFKSVISQMQTHDDLILVVDGKATGYVKNLWSTFSPKGELVELQDGPHGDWGHTPRNIVLPSVESGYVINFDDDDVIPTGGLDRVRAAINQKPGDLLLFQMRRDDGSIIPDGEIVKEGNVGTPMLVFPSGISLGKFGSHYAGGYNFIKETIEANPDRSLRWVKDVIIDIRPTDKPVVVESGNGLGDNVEFALTAIGITKERVSNWLGAPCNCEGRKQKLNKLGKWAASFARTTYDKARESIESLIST